MRVYNEVMQRVEAQHHFYQHQMCPWKIYITKNGMGLNKRMQSNTRVLQQKLSYMGRTSQNIVLKKYCKSCQMCQHQDPIARSMPPRQMYPRGISTSNFSMLCLKPPHVWSPIQNNEWDRVISHYKSICRTILVSAKIKTCVACKN